ncbi:MAG: flagellar biosynthesis protein FlhF [Burkholderiales bacterium]|nr:flagellar biosynthesis protein FlhF [Burkholderiales bacterium]
MNARRFTARSPREALMAVRQAFGDEAVVLSTRPCAEGVEVLAMAPGSLQQIERVTPPPARAGAASRPAAEAPLAGPESASEPRAEARASVERDVQMLGMSTLSFQDYVRERMLRRRQAELDARSSAPKGMPTAARSPVASQAAPQTAPARPAAAGSRPMAGPEAGTAHEVDDEWIVAAPAGRPAAAAQASGSTDAEGWAGPGLRPQPGPAAATHAAPEARLAEPPLPEPMRSLPEPADTGGMMQELRSMRSLIEQRFGALAFMEKLQRQPRQARLAQRLLELGFSPQLVRKLVAALPDDVDEDGWAASVLERNLATGEADGALEDRGGVLALVGSTGVGKTTSTAKLAAAFATRHGAAQLGLVTLDAYRLGAHEQLRAYGRILGVPVHTAHDRASLEDLLDLLAGKRLVLIDTAGMAQRDARTRELLEMLSHRSIQRLLVVNAAAQGETIEDVLVSYRAASCKGVILAKVDEAIKLAPALDAVIRHQLPVLAVANGQRVPEDWHRLSAQALLQRALRGGGGPAWRLDADEVNLVFAGLPAAAGADHRATAALA